MKGKKRRGPVPKKTGEVPRKEKGMRAKRLSWFGIMTFGWGDSTSVKTATEGGQLKRKRAHPTHFSRKNIPEKGGDRNKGVPFSMLLVENRGSVAALDGQKTGKFHEGKRSRSRIIAKGDSRSGKRSQFTGGKIGNWGTQKEGRGEKKEGGKEKKTVPSDYQEKKSVSARRLQKKGQLLTKLNAEGKWQQGRRHRGERKNTLSEH